MAVWSSSCFLIRLAHFHSSYLGTICFHYCVSSLLQLYLWLPPTPLWQQQCLFSSHPGFYARLFRRSINLILLQVWTLDSLRQMYDELNTDPDVLLKNGRMHCSRLAFFECCCTIINMHLYDFTLQSSVGLHSSVYYSSRFDDTWVMNDSDVLHRPEGSSRYVKFLHCQRHQTPDTKLIGVQVSPRQHKQQNKSFILIIASIGCVFW